MTNLNNFDEEFAKELYKSSLRIYEVLKSVLVRNYSESIEAVLLSILGPLFGAYNPNQLSEITNLSDTTIYRKIDFVTCKKWMELIRNLGYNRAKEELKEIFSKSASTISRANVVFAIDDSLFKRISKEISYVWKWWSGAMKKVSKGHNIIALVVVINDLMIPLDIRVVSKQGKNKKNKHDLAYEMVNLFRNFLLENGFTEKEISRIEIVTDSWYGCPELQEKFSKIKMTFIFEGKGSYVFNDSLKGKQLKESELLINFKNYKLFRKRLKHKKFGEVTAIVFQSGEEKRYCLTPAKKRAVEIFKALKQRHKIEEFWKTLKTTLKTLEMKLRSRNGVYAILSIRFATFFLLLNMKVNLTFGKIIQKCQRTFGINIQHFHEQLLLSQNLSVT